jgi:hypothetical protein
MNDGPFAAQNLFDDRDVIAQPRIGLAPRLPVPALHDLRAGHAYSEDHSSLSGHGIDGLGAHG